MEQVAHRVHEDHSRLGPAQRIRELLRDQPNIETLLEWMSLHAPEPLGESLRIAVLAARADLRAPAHRVPRCVGPFDFRIEAHYLSDQKAFAIPSTIGPVHLGMIALNLTF